MSSSPFIPYGANPHIQMVPQENQSTAPCCSIYLNPHFNKKVFINPNFQFDTEVITQPRSSERTKIYLNPNIFKSLNPKKESNQVTNNPTVFSTRTKLIRSTAKIPAKPAPRRNSVISQYKIIKSTCISKPSIPKNAIKMKLPHLHKPMREGNKFKLDNRKLKLSPLTKNRKNKILHYDYTKKSLCLVKIGEALYRKSRNTLQKTTNTKTVMIRKLNRLVTPNTIRYKPKLVSLKAKIPSNGVRNVCKKRVIINARIIPQKKMKLSNIPCLYYRKFGKCSGLKNGKCFRKHDPAQIALCTKFLQGACVNEKCSLSHNVSPEKMPTCKFYLEGFCSKDNCPYVHVKLSPKADICKDFLEGFCKNGANCDLRHQLLCPYYEKTGNCPKPRCPYPHGKMVRKYTVGDKYKLTNRQPELLQNVKLNLGRKAVEKLPLESASKITVKSRYYTDLLVLKDAVDSNDLDYCGSFGVKSTIDQLPSFIALR